MYTPLQPGVKTKHRHEVLYKEHFPRDLLSQTVNCYWEVRSLTKLREDFQYLILPDGCVDAVFDVGEKPCSGDAIIMALDIRADTITLGREFHYVGIRFQPGTWLKNPERLIGKADIVSELAGLDMPELTRKLRASADFSQKLILLEELAQACQDTGLVKVNRWLQRVFANPDRVNSVADIVELSGYSTRHVQRIFKEQTGYSPHDFLKIIRFQQSLLARSRDAYSDQSHYIHQFKRMTGFTPKLFQTTY